MPGLTVSTTTDSPEQVQEALAHYGYGQESVEIIQTKAEDPPKTETPNEAPPAPPDGDKTPAKPEDKSAAAPGAATHHQEPEPGATEDKGKPAQGEVSPAVQKRIDKAVAKQREAERAVDTERLKREDLERRLADLEAPAAPAKTEPGPSALDTAKAGDDAEPVLDAFENYEDWVKAHQKWTAREESAPLRAEIEALKIKLEGRDRDEAAQKARQPLVDAWVEKVDKAKAAHSDYDEVTGRSDEEGLIATPAMHQEIFESDQGAEIVYFLATHPEECRRIAELTAVPKTPTPDQVGKAIRIAAREIAMIEARLQPPTNKAPETPKPKPSNAPAPIRTVGGKSAAGTKDPGEMSPAEYADWREAHPKG
jgi:hypothetical protein